MGFLALGIRRWPLVERFGLTRHLAEAAAIAGSLLVKPGAGGAVLALSVGVHLLTVAVAWLAALSVAAPFSFLQALMLVPPILLVSMIPVSIAGWGLREGAMVMGFVYAGLAPDDGLLVSVLLGGAMLAVGMIGGAVWLADGARRPANLWTGIQPAKSLLLPRASR